MERLVEVHEFHALEAFHGLSQSNLPPSTKSNASMLPPSLLGKDDKLGPILLGLLAATAAFYSIRNWKSNDNSTNNEVKRVSFLPGSPLLGNTPRLLDWVFERTQQRDGQPFAVQILGKNDLIYTSQSEHFEQVLKEQSNNFNRSDILHDVYVNFMGESILIVDGDRWKYHRKVLVNLFSTRASRDVMTPIIQKNIGVLMDILSRACETGETLDFHKLVNKFTLETFVEIGFGLKLGNLTSPDDHPFELAFDEAHHISANRLAAPTWLWKVKRWLNVGSERRLRESMEVINAFLMDTISGMMTRREANKLQDQRGNKDILSIVLDTMESSGQTLTPEDIRDIVFTSVIAGRDTTADALADTNWARKEEEEAFIPDTCASWLAVVVAVVAGPAMLAATKSILSMYRGVAVQTSNKSVVATATLQYKPRAQGRRTARPAGVAGASSSSRQVVLPRASPSRAVLVGTALVVLLGAVVPLGLVLAAWRLVRE